MSSYKEVHTMTAQDYHWKELRQSHFQQKGCSVNIQYNLTVDSANIKAA